MLECPFCGERVPHEGWGKWFRCPLCKNWLCPHGDQSGLKWIESRVAVDEQASSGRPPGEGGPPRPNQNRASPPITPQNVNNMERPAVRPELEKVRIRLRQLTNAIGRESRLREQNSQSEQLVRQYDVRLRRLKQEAEELRQYERRLVERENELQEVDTPTADPGRGSPAGLIFGCGTGLGFASIMAFTLTINLHLDPRAFTWVIIIAVVSGAFTWLIAQMNR